MEVSIEDLSTVELNSKILNGDLKKISEEDFEVYDLGGIEDDPFNIYGEEVRAGNRFYDDDVRFALLDLGWRVRLEDKFGGNTLEKVEKLIDEKGKRFGFIFAHTMLNSVHAVEDDDTKIFVGNNKDSKYVISNDLQKFLVEKIGDYFDSIDEVNDANADKVMNDVRGLGRTVSRLLLNIDYWKDIQSLRKKSIPVGDDGYLEVDNAIDLYKIINKFKKKDFVAKQTEMEAYLAMFESYEEKLKKLGVVFD